MRTTHFLPDGSRHSRTETKTVHPNGKSDLRVEGDGWIHVRTFKEGDVMEDSGATSKNLKGSNANRARELEEGLFREDALDSFIDGVMDMVKTQVASCQKGLMACHSHCHQILDAQQ